MKIHEIAITILVIGLMVTGGVMYINDLGSNNGQTADLSAINQTTEHIATIQSDAQELKNQTDQFVPDDESSTAILIPYRFLVAAWIMIKILWRSVTTLGTFGAIINSALVDFGLSVPFANLIISTLTAILWIAVGAIIIFTFFKWKMED